jgi:hypothetical protein
MKSLAPLENVVRLLTWSAVVCALVIALFVVWGLVLHGLPGGAASGVIGAAAVALVVSVWERQHFGRILNRLRGERARGSRSSPS